MIAGKFYLENYANWCISYYMLTDSSDAHPILRRLRRIGCSKKFMRKAERLLSSNQRNIGLAYSNKGTKKSVIVVSETTNVWEFFNSFTHEVDHLEKHIAKALDFSPYSESASYLVGELVRNMFYNIFLNYDRTYRS